uniref:Putative secreted protein n=1 Tax=Anopheles darlingi TaxID=43151 RepID=A0A2M4D7C0_ANODA
MIADGSLQKKAFNPPFTLNVLVFLFLLRQAFFQLVQAIGHAFERIFNPCLNLAIALHRNHEAFLEQFVGLLLFRHRRVHRLQLVAHVGKVAEVLRPESRFEGFDFLQRLERSCQIVGYRVNVHFLRLDVLLLLYECRIEVRFQFVLSLKRLQNCTSGRPIR